MERTFENVSFATEKKATRMLLDAAESLLANLPILVLGMVVALALAGDMFV